jgi:hypothetical protein
MIRRVEISIIKEKSKGKGTLDDVKKKILKE